MAGGSDVVVVGGGIIGAACARELAESGARVTLVERAELAAGASGRNAGLWGSPTDPALVPMARASLDAYRRFADQTPIPLLSDREPLGMVSVIRPDQEPLIAAEAEAMSGVGVKAELLDRAALRDLEPELSHELEGAWLFHDGYRLDPAALTVALALRAGELGAEVRHHLNVRALLHQGDRVIGVVTDEGTLPADAVVLAAGPWTSDLLRPLGVGLPLAGARGWLVRLLPSRPPISHWIEADARSLLRGMAPDVTAAAFAQGISEPDVGAMFGPAPDGTIVCGVSRQPALANEPDDPEVPRRIVRETVRLVPSLAGSEVISAWWGIRPMTPDERPVVGFVHEGLLLATGHGSQGVILGTGTAALVVSMLAGEPPPFDPTAFAPDRFA